MLAEANLNRDDAYYVVAHIVRSVSALNQVIFALNDEYCINEKKAVTMIDGFPIHPNHYKESVDLIFALVGTNMPEACRRLEDLIAEVALKLPFADDGPSWQNVMADFLRRHNSGL